MDKLYHPVKYDAFMRICIDDGDMGQPVVDPNMAKAKRLLSEGLSLLVMDKKPADERELYPIICKSFCLVLNGSNCAVKDIAEWRETETGCDFGPDLALYPNHSEARLAFARDKDLQDLEIPSDRHTHIARTSFTWMIMPIEVKSKRASGFLFDTNNPNKLLYNEKGGPNARAQHAKYVAEIFLRQHRTHVFSVCLYRQYARLFRWDRNGVITSSPIDMIDEPEKILNFTYRVSNLSKGAMGIDTSVKLANAAHIKKLETYCDTAKNPTAKSMVQELLDNRLVYPIMRVPCQLTAAEIEARTEKGEATLDGKRYFLIGKHASGHHSPGRGTKGYIALELPSTSGGASRLCYLKDYWRPMHRRVHTELETYRKLCEAKVQCVAQAVAGGDVCDATGVKETTKTLSLLGKIDNRAVDLSVERRHYRLVTREIGRPLESCSSSDVLIYALLQAYGAHISAWKTAEVLHCDISASNILISIDSKDGNIDAFLNDWDLCKWKEDLKEPATQLSGRSGTWPYMSAHLLRYPKKPNEVEDDAESFVYVLVENVLRFHPHSYSILRQATELSPEQLETTNQKNVELRDYIFSFFYQEIELEAGYVGGGGRKHEHILTGHLPFEAKDPQLDKLLWNIYTLLQRHYETVKVSGVLAKYHVPQLGDSEYPQVPPKAEDSVLCAPPSNSRGKFGAMHEQMSVLEYVSGPSKPEVDLRIPSHPASSERPFNIYEAMFSLLYNYLHVVGPDPAYPGRMTKVLRPFRGPDKTQDQFYGFRRPVWVESTMPSSGSNATSGSRHMIPAYYQPESLSALNEDKEEENEVESFLIGKFEDMEVELDSESEGDDDYEDSGNEGGSLDEEQ